MIRAVCWAAPDIDPSTNLGNFTLQQLATQVSIGNLGADRSMESTRLSVGLPTRNRPESLRRTLESLRAQSIQPYEVVVSDDSDDEYVMRVKQIVEEMGCRYLRGPRQGLYANRNNVARACRGTHVRTMDDDHEFPAGHMQKCIDAVNGDAKSVWIIGEFLPNTVDVSKVPACPGEINPRFSSSTPADPDRTWAIADGASIYPREIFDRGLFFSEAFKFGAIYLEFGSRLHWLGYRIRFLPNTYIIHHMNSAVRSYMDSEIDLASRCFAALCHYFIYQPRPIDQLLSILYALRNAIPLGPRGFRGIWNGYKAFRDQRKLLSSTIRSVHS